VNFNVLRDGAIGVMKTPTL